MKASILRPAMVAIALVLGSTSYNESAAAVTNGYITALLRSSCTDVPFPPPPVGEIATGPDYVIMTVADGDPSNYQAAQQLVTDAIFESLMPLYCALPHGTGIGCVTNRVQWNLMTYDAGGNPRVSGGPTSGPSYHYFSPCSVTPRERIQNLIAWVNAGMTTGFVRNGGSLTAKLNAALGSAAGAKTQAALSQMQAFLREVDAMAKGGRLTPAAAQTLREAGSVVTAELARPAP